MHGLAGSAFQEVVDRGDHDHGAGTVVEPDPDQAPIRTDDPASLRGDLDEVNEGGVSIRRGERALEVGRREIRGGTGITRAQQTALHGNQVGSEEDLRRCSTDSVQDTFHLRLVSMFEDLVGLHRFIDHPKLEPFTDPSPCSGNPRQRVHDDASLLDEPVGHEGGQGECTRCRVATRDGNPVAGHDVFGEELRDPIGPFAQLFRVGMSRSIRRQISLRRVEAKVTPEVDDPRAPRRQLDTWTSGGSVREGEEYQRGTGRNDAIDVERFQDAVPAVQLRVHGAKPLSGLPPCSQVDSIEQGMSVDEPNQLAAGIPRGTKNGDGCWHLVTVCREFATIRICREICNGPREDLRSFSEAGQAPIMLLFRLGTWWTQILAHQYGWDEIILFAVPIVLALIGVRWAEKRAKQKNDE